MTKRLENMTWEEAREAVKTHRLGIIPTGSIEQHGPHLPLGTDFLIADRLAKRVAEKTDAIVTPTIPIGFASYHQDFEGTLSATPETLAAYYLDVANSLILYGVTHVLFINGHGGNAGALTSVCRDLRDRGIASAFVQWWQIAGGINEKWSMIGHGDISETSIMLAISGENVHLDRAATPENKWLTDEVQITDLTVAKFGPGYINSYFRTGDVSDTGDFLEYGHSATADYSTSPAGATAENGEEILSVVTDYILDFIEQFKKIHFEPATAPFR
jgi:creatinine amidohydrolase